MTARRLRVLLVGASGVFGSRLAEGLAREPGIASILAGRTLASLAKLGSDLGGTPETAVLDRDRATQRAGSRQDIPLAAHTATSAAIHSKQHPDKASIHHFANDFTTGRLVFHRDGFSGFSRIPGNAHRSHDQATLSYFQHHTIAFMNHGRFSEIGSLNREIG